MRQQNYTSTENIGKQNTGETGAGRQLKIALLTNTHVNEWQFDIEAESRREYTVVDRVHHNVADAVTQQLLDQEDMFEYPELETKEIYILKFFFY